MRRKDIASTVEKAVERGFVVYDRDSQWLVDSYRKLSDMIGSPKVEVYLKTVYGSLVVDVTKQPQPVREKVRSLLVNSDTRKTRCYGLLPNRTILSVDMIPVHMAEQVGEKIVAILREDGVT